MALMIHKAPCKKRKDEPSGYGAYHDWTAKMGRNHRQKQCKRCGFWHIWVSKKK